GAWAHPARAKTTKSAATRLRQFSTFSEPPLSAGNLADQLATRAEISRTSSLTTKRASTSTRPASGTCSSVRRSKLAPWPKRSRAPKAEREHAGRHVGAARTPIGERARPPSQLGPILSAQHLQLSGSTQNRNVATAPSKVWSAKFRRVTSICRN